MKIDEDVPSFIPVKGQVFIETASRTILRKKSVSLGKSIEVYQLMND
jgi:hypothetical protein